MIYIPTRYKENGRTLLIPHPIGKLGASAPRWVNCAGPRRESVPAWSTLLQKYSSNLTNFIQEIPLDNREKKIIHLIFMKEIPLK